jgi:adhesin HecA-like repeat protein
MTTDVLKVSGNYIVEANNGTVTVAAPLTVINGNLTVLGTSTTVQSTVATISDNIIVLNSGEVGPGVTLGTSGIMIARGNSDDPSVAASFYFDESFSFPHPVYGTLKGQWKFGGDTSLIGKIVQLYGVTIPTLAHTLTFFSSYNPNAVLSVEGTTNYENNIIHDDHIPNKKYVDDKLAVGTSIAQELKVGKSFVRLNSPDVLISDPYYGVVDKIFAGLGTSTNIVFKLEGQDADIQGFRLNKGAASISVIATNTNLTLNPGGLANSTGTLVVNSAMRIVQTIPVSTQSGYTSIYTTSTVGGGGTGLYYVNTTGKDELVSRRRSIIYGIIF